MLTIAQQADLRMVCLEFLAIRYPNGYAADAIARMLMRRQRVDYPVTSSDITAATAYLMDEGMARKHMDNLSVTPAWSATSAGVARYQRGRVASNPAEGEM